MTTVAITAAIALLVGVVLGMLLRDWQAKRAYDAFLLDKLSSRVTGKIDPELRQHLEDIDPKHRQMLDAWDRAQPNHVTGLPLRPLHPDYIAEASTFRAPTKEN